MPRAASPPPSGQDDSPEPAPPGYDGGRRRPVDEEAVRILVTEAADRIADLVSFGVPFDTVDGEVRSGQGGGPQPARASSTPAAMLPASTSSVTLGRSSARVEDRDPGALPGRRTSWSKGRRCQGCAGARLPHRNDSEQFELPISLVLATGGAGQLFQVHHQPRRGHRRRRVAGLTAPARRSSTWSSSSSTPRPCACPACARSSSSEAVRGEGGTAAQRRGPPLHAGLPPEKPNWRPGTSWRAASSTR